MHIGKDSFLIVGNQVIWERGGRRGVGRGERIIKCHQFDTTWGSDAILVLESHVAAGQVDVCGLLTGFLILTSPAGRFFLKKKGGTGE